jgi:hypothetical protein
MSDTLVRLLSDHQPRPFPHGGFGCTGCTGRFVTRGDHARHVADLIAAEFLVVARSDIVGTEYGWQCTTVDGLPKAKQRVPGGRESAIRDARRVRRNQEAEGLAPDVELLSRPVLPWSVTPLPENGEKP